MDLERITELEKQVSQLTPLEAYLLIEVKRLHGALLMVATLAGRATKTLEQECGDAKAEPEKA